MLVASGPSADRETVELFKGRARILTVNTSFRLAPWGDVLYACDGEWWEEYPDGREFAGLKVTYHKPTAEKYGLHCIDLVESGSEGANGLSLQPGVLCRGGNGGQQALNLAVQFGAKRIAGLGLDFHGGHWHEPHPRERFKLRNPSQATMDKWRANFDALAPQLASLGVEFVNLSPISSLTAYPKMHPRDVLERWTHQ